MAVLASQDCVGTECSEWYTEMFKEEQYLVSFCQLTKAGII